MLNSKDNIPATIKLWTALEPEEKEELVIQGYSLFPELFNAKNPKKYMTQLSKVIALVACSPALSAIAGLWNMVAALIVLIGTGVLFIWLGTKIVHNEE